ncbi:unnamed protein product [Fusarium graminearum]|uniref:Chromosome 1, complete genome n=1 Tax=Gibberella zeae (strain ATCC MYA-4620 / CBS 123657 / FGSC 9075 / NRRL 31084 / PH-1) TaxID=229533 RepID=A0A098D9N1_GIBZE|nr:unnamed protein product [Fusarium graminearum]
MKELPSVENTISELAAEGIRDEITREDVFHGSTAAFHCGNGPTITKVHDHEIAWARQSLETHYSPLHISCYTHDIGIRPNPSSSLGASENRQSIAGTLNLYIHTYLPTYIRVCSRHPSLLVARVWWKAKRYSRHPARYLLQLISASPSVPKCRLGPRTGWLEAHAASLSGLGRDGKMKTGRPRF